MTVDTARPTIDLAQNLARLHPGCGVCTPEMFQKLREREMVLTPA